ncbi:hypothetical protein [Psychroserpens algicola]|uniref:hypothetical protein n=1 Tax=Psychroserpens algicola TaxID=1719034 RepID=UPI001954C109|nr:hypothetical protein [Psychroserpens algicola]
MRKSIVYNSILLFIFFLSLNSYSQKNSDYLDVKNGFIIFTFGDLYSTYSNRLIKEKKRLNITGTTFYKYNGVEPSDLFGVAWDKISLGFTKNKLTDVEVRWNYNSNHFKTIRNDLENVFGKPQISDTGYTVTYFWKSKKNYYEVHRKKFKVP